MCQIKKRLEIWATELVRSGLSARIESLKTIIQMLTLVFKVLYYLNFVICEVTFFSQSTDVFVITSNRWTFFFTETENLNFSQFEVIRKALVSSDKKVTLFQVNPLSEHERFFKIGINLVEFVIEVIIFWSIQVGFLWGRFVKIWFGFKSSFDRCELNLKGFSKSGLTLLNLLFKSSFFGPFKWVIYEEGYTKNITPPTWQQCCNLSEHTPLWWQTQGA